MSIISDPAFQRGDYMRRLDQLERWVIELRSARRLESASVGAGGLRIIRGGILTVQDGGHIQIRDGGNLSVFDGGGIRARYTDGTTAVGIGPIYNAALTELIAHGLLVQDDAAGDNMDIFRAYRTVGGNREVILGQGSGAAPIPIQLLLAFTEFFTVFNTENVNILCDKFVTIESGANNLFLRSTGSDVNLQADNGTIWVQGGNDFNVGVDGNIWLTSGNNATFISHTIDAGLAANCHIGGDGHIFSTASSRRYKKDIDDAHVNPDEVLELKPRTWKDKNSERPGVGFIAEEVAELPTLDQFVIHDDEGPQSIAYDRLTAALIPLLQRQHTQIDELTRRVESLETKLASLTEEPTE